MSVAQKRQIVTEYKEKVEEHYRMRELDVLLVMNQSFSSYDRERKLFTLSGSTNDVGECALQGVKRKYNWANRTFNRAGLLEKVRSLKGEKVKIFN